ncbi:hypothetical protein B0H13DRAFT_2353696 [Mycena leptocephala]|nr:hypothetical protein B0H13DRAFT_2353696 [Mycena leptocephala]
MTFQLLVVIQTLCNISVGGVVRVVVNRAVLEAERIQSLHPQRRTKNLVRQLQRADPVLHVEHLGGNCHRDGELAVRQDLASKISAHETDRTWPWESKAAWGPSSYTDNLITSLITQFIETASFSTLNSIMDLIIVTVLQTTNFHFVFALLSGRVYTNTLLATLNSREKMREDMGGIHTTGRLHSTPAFMYSTAVHISAEQHHQGDMEMETKDSSQKEILRHLSSRVSFTLGFKFRANLLP